MGLTNPGRAVRQLATIDFYNAIDSVWHLVRFHKLISAGLSFCFVHGFDLIISFWQERLWGFSKSSKLLFSSSPKPSTTKRFWYCYFLSFQQRPSSVSTFLCQLFSIYWQPGRLVLFPSVPTAVDATQGVCLDWSAGVSLLIRANVRPFSYRWNLIQLHLFLFNSPVNFNSSSTFLGFPLISFPFPIYLLWGIPSFPTTYPVSFRSVVL